MSAEGAEPAPTDGRAGRRAMKLRIPDRPRHYVRRARLLHQLDDDAAVTLLVAPAGAGKTVLLSGWAREASCPVAWLSPDSADAGGRPFWLAVAASLDAIAPGVGDGARGLLRERAPLGDVAIRLVEDLEERLSSPSVFVLDDLHNCEDPTVASSLGLFLKHLPAPMRIVIGTRHVPALPIDRMRAEGRLAELHFDELRFSPAESQELLGLLCPSSTAEELVEVAASSAGWVAGLQLAALRVRATATSSPDDDRPRPHDGFVAEYLWSEVFDAEKPELTELLLDVAVAERLNASLAEAISGRADAAAMLARAENRGLFVSRLDRHGWFELHSVVREVLLAQRGRTDPSRLRSCHRRAAEWLEREGDAVAALDHWRLAGEDRDALRLLATTQVELYDAGREQTIRDLIAALEPSTTADLTALVDLTWCYLLTDRAKFLECVDELAWWAQHRPVPKGEVVGRVTTLESIAAIERGDWAEGGRLARVGLAAFDEWWRDPIGRTGWNNVARVVALSERWDDAADEVRDLTVTLRREPHRRPVFEATRALGLALSGRPVDALRVAAGVRASTTVGNLVISRAELALAEALAHRELGGPTDASAELAALVDVDAEPTTYVRGIAALELVNVHLDAGDLAAAAAAFDRAKALIDDQLPGVGGRSLLGRTGTTLAAASGDHAAATAWAGTVEDPFWGPVSAARVQLAAADRDGAVVAIDAAVPRCPRHELVLALLRARAATDHDMVDRHAAAAVDVAVASGMLQSVQSEGGVNAAMIERVSWRAPAPWMDRLRRATVGRPASGSPAGAVRRPLEPLTERERDVLRFLPSRLTTAEIADELYVSVNTLKFHLKVIYRKLGVNSRSEAAEFARTWSGSGGGDRT